jgi:hypothetical protein
MKISDWSAVRVKAKKFEEVDFDNLVTEENLRQFLGYNISRNKEDHHQKKSCQEKK